MKNTELNKSNADYDVCIIGAGASGLMCAIESAQRGRKVIILEKAKKAAKKILISGGGRCNFTNIGTTDENFISGNPHFCKSALARYTPWDFLQLIEEEGLSWNEKAKGQLFCDQKAPAIAALLINKYIKLGGTIAYLQNIATIKATSSGYEINTNTQMLSCQSLVVACGGPSIPKMGATDFALQVAKQFNQMSKPFVAALVPFTIKHRPSSVFNNLSGVSLPVTISCNNQLFTDNLLITHRGLSGPSVLQISSYWKPGDKIIINLLPNISLKTWLPEQQLKHPQVSLNTALSKILPKRLSQNLTQILLNNVKLNQLNKKTIEKMAKQLHAFTITPEGTEGFRTAEVSTGGVSTSAISSKTFESLSQKNLYFIGESIDVTGQLGGYNFQWAWASGWCAGQYV